jgi:YD repeat-containing protein
VTWKLSVRDALAIAVVILLLAVLPRIIDGLQLRGASASHPGANMADLVPRGPLYLVHLGEPTTLDLQAFRAYYAQTLGLDVTVLPPLALDPADFDSRRRQFVAERVIASMRRSVPDVAKDPKAILIGVMEQDMYIAKYSWNFAFTLRADERASIVSSARMQPSDNTSSADADLLISRVRKMVTKNIGLLVYGLPLSNDPTSVLYRNVGGVEELDVMQEQFEGAGTKSIPAASVDASYPCFIVSPLTDWDRQTPVEARIDRCMPGLRMDRQFDELEVDLRQGVLVTRHSDFFTPDTMPIALTRAYHSLDNISRAFGIGGNHPYDILPVGNRNPYTYIDLVMPDGGLIHYDRISKGFGYADAVYEHHARTAFLGSRFSWNGDGWDLRFTNGSLFVFPENYSGPRNNHGAPVAMQDGAGHHIVFQRDRDRNLMRLISPAGHSLKFEYDEGYRVRQGTDDQGRVVRYEYDADGRLALTTDGTRRTRFRYEDGLLSSIATDAGPLVDITYREKHVTNLAFANGHGFQFSPVFGNGPDRPATGVEVTDDHGVKTSVPLAH